MYDDFEYKGRIEEKKTQFTLGWFDVMEQTAPLGGIQIYV